MAIYGIGAYYDTDVSEIFIKKQIIGCGWAIKQAPELHQYIKSLKIGDIVYIKSFSARSKDIIVKAIGVIINNDIVVNDYVKCGRNVKWFSKEEIRIEKPKEKNNVRLNTIYEEFHPDIQKRIIQSLSTV